MLKLGLKHLFKAANHVSCFLPSLLKWLQGLGTVGQTTGTWIERFRFAQVLSKPRLGPTKASKEYPTFWLRVFMGYLRVITGFLRVFYGLPKTRFLSKYGFCTGFCREEYGFGREEYGILREEYGISHFLTNKTKQTDWKTLAAVHNCWLVYYLFCVSAMNSWFPLLGLLLDG